MSVGESARRGGLNSESAQASRGAWWNRRPGRHKSQANDRRALDDVGTAWYPRDVNYEPQWHVVLREPEIPHNTGSVGRTCVAVGAKLWLVRPLGFRVDDYYLRRAGLDYWERLEWEVVDDWSALLERLPRDRHAYWFFTKKATRAHWDVTFGRQDVLVFGGETRGLPPGLLAEAGDHALRIPIRDAVRSLNLSNSVAIALFEACRPKGQSNALAAPNAP